MFFEYLCLWVARKRCVAIETNLPPSLTPPGGGFRSLRWWTFDLGVQARPAEIRR
jgi:hypothetical protein